MTLKVPKAYTWNARFSSSTTYAQLNISTAVTFYDNIQWIFLFTIRTYAFASAVLRIQSSGKFTTKRPVLIVTIYAKYITYKFDVVSLAISVAKTIMLTTRFFVRRRKLIPSET